MNFELFVARKVYLSKSAGGARQVTPPAVRIAVAGLALGVATMIIAVAVVTGFKKEVRNKIIGFGAHIRISNFDNNSSYDTAPIYLGDTLIGQLQTFPGIAGIDAYATKPGILKTATDFQGIVVKGVEPDYDWRFFDRHLIEGALPTFAPDRASTDVLVSQTLARMLGLKCGGSFLAYFVQDQVRARKFRISGIYNTGFVDYDKLFVIADIRQVRALNGWEAHAVSGLELTVDRYDRLDATADALYHASIDWADSRGNTLYVRSIKELNPMLFGWLGVLDLNVVIILVLMMAVAGFTMIAGLLIIILERTRMIGILKALGQPDGSLRKVFLYIASFLIGKGMLWGNAIALVCCAVQYWFKPLALDPANYYLDAVPVDLDPAAWLLINVGVAVVALAMMLGPSYLITKISPSRTIRFE